jgi:hypothetical protein
MADVRSGPRNGHAYYACTPPPTATQPATALPAMFNKSGHGPWTPAPQHTPCSHTPGPAQQHGERPSPPVPLRPLCVILHHAPPITCAVPRLTRADAEQCNGRGQRRAVRVPTRSSAAAAWGGGGPPIPRTHSTPAHCTCPAARHVGVMIRPGAPWCSCCPIR